VRTGKYYAQLYNPGVRLKGWVRAQVFFSSVLPARGKCVKGSEQILLVNKLLHSRYGQWAFNFYSNGTISEDSQLLERNGIQEVKQKPLRKGSPNW